MADESGHLITDNPESADVIVVNTCGFIGAAKEESVDTILEMAEFKKTGRCRRPAVSYTHLDVYKRQLLVSMSSPGSLGRFLIVVFPAFIALALLPWSRRVWIAVLTLSGALLAMNAVKQSLGQWVAG